MRAAVAVIGLRRSAGLMRAVDVVEPLEALRYRWRGGATELPPKPLAPLADPPAA